MKREIKFRAWHRRYHVMRYEITDLDGWLSDSDCIVMQYTGLKDKNGKEIYDGDIVAFPRHGWEEDRFVDKIYWSNRAGGWNINSILAPTSEVIGNIYEHPELLEQ